MEHTPRIAVVGAGTMGSGIAQVCARALAAVTGAMVRQQEKGNLTDDAVHAARRRLFGATHADALRHCVLAALEVVLHASTDPEYRPAPLLQQMADAGHLRRKSGQGFYTHAATN